jgi:flagellar motor switch protein FliG
VPDNALTLRPARLAPGGVEKAAILLLTLGPEVATNVFQHLSEAEVRQLSTAIARLRSISKEQAAAVHEEAWRRLTNRDGFLVDGEQFAKKLVTTTLGSGSRERQTQAMLDIERATHDSRVLMATSLGSVAPAVLAQVLATEHPQVIAFILANLNPRQAAEVLGKLPEEQAPDLMLRIADLKRGTSPDVLAEVSNVLHGQAKGLGGAEPGPSVGGMKLAAEIMNLLDKTVENRVFAQLDESAPDVAERIRDLMLTFEDLLALENRDMQTLLKDVPREDLILALKTASPGMREKIFKNISARAAEILQDDMSQMGPVKLKDVEKAQATIVSVARRLADEQKITIGGSGGDALV